MLSPDRNDASYNLWHVANISNMFLNFSDVFTMSAVRLGWSFTLVKELHKVSMFFGCMCAQCIGTVIQIRNHYTYVYLKVPAVTCAHDFL